MKNALILHGTDFDNDKKQHLNNWFPWLKAELKKNGYMVWAEELPEAINPNLEHYWNVLKDFNFNSETIIIGHSSGGSAVFGLLHKLPLDKKVKLAVSVAGFYKDEGWNSAGLFTEDYDWAKIKNQAKEIVVITSDDDPYVKILHAEYFADKLGISPLVIKSQKHFSVQSFGESYKEFPKLLEIIRNSTLREGRNSLSQ